MIQPQTSPVQAASSMTRDPPVLHGRVVVIGDSSVGKTCLVSRMMEDRFDSNEQPTVGANWQLYVRNFNNDRVELQIWDTAGQEKFRALGPLYYRSALGAIAVFDVSSRESFVHLGSWIDAFTEVAGTDVRIVIAANKSDLEEDRQVRVKESRDWASARGWMIYETSARTGENVESLFQALAEAILSNRYPEEQKTLVQPQSRNEPSKCC
jgi:small GTP-binding protein